MFWDEHCGERVNQFCDIVKIGRSVAPLSAEPTEHGPIYLIAINKEKYVLCQLTKVVFRLAEQTPVLWIKSMCDYVHNNVGKYHAGAASRGFPE